MPSRAGDDEAFDPEETEWDEVEEDTSALSERLREIYLRWRKLFEAGLLDEAERLLEAQTPEDRRVLEGEIAFVQRVRRDLHDGLGLAPGKELFGYRLIAKIGEGGTATIWKARCIRSRREVALKILRPGYGLVPEAMERFRRAIGVKGSLDHENVVEVLDIYEQDVLHALALELIEPSITLHDQLVEAGEATPPPIASPVYQSKTARQFLQLARGLEHVHARDWIHRDVKPANVLVAPDGRVKLTDFGIARHASDPKLTADAATLGTHSYMSPETLTAGSHPVSAASDIFSFGVSLYEALTLKLPFDEEQTVDLADRYLFETPLDPRAVNDSIDPRLAGIVKRATWAQPRQRYANMSAVIEDLEHFLADRPTNAHRLAPLHHLRQRLLPYRGALKQAAGLALLIGAGATGYRFKNSDVTASPAQGIVEEKAERDRQQARLRFGEARIHFGEGRSSAALAALEGVPLTHQSAWEWRYLRLQADNSTVDQGFQATEAPIDGVQIEPPGNSVLVSQGGSAWRWNPEWRRASPLEAESVQPPVEAYYDLQAGAPVLAGLLGRLRTVQHSAFGLRREHDVAGGAPSATLVSLDPLDPGAGQGVLPLESLQLPIACSTDGSRIAGRASGCEFLVLDASNLREPVPFVIAQGDARRLSWSGDSSRLLASGTPANTIEVFSAADGQPIASTPAGIGPFACSASADLIATVEPGGALAVRRLGELEPVRLLTGLAGPITALDLSADGQMLVAGNARGELRLWDLYSPTAHIELASHRQQPKGLTLDPHGRTIASASKDGAIFLWDADTGQRARTLRGHFGEARGLAFVDGGRLLVSIDGRPRVLVWDQESERPGQVIELSEFDPIAVAGHPTRALAAVVDRSGQLALVEQAQAGAEFAVRQLELGAEQVSFSADGEWIYAVEGRWLGRLSVASALTSANPLGSPARREPQLAAEVRCTALAAAPAGGPVVAAYSDGTLWWWSADLQAEPRVLRAEHRAFDVAFDDTGSRLAVVNALGNLQLVDLEEGRVAFEFTCDVPLGRVAFDPGAQRFLALDHEGQLHTFEAEGAAARSLWAAELQRRPARSRVEALFDAGLMLDAVTAELTLARRQGDPLAELAAEVAQIHGQPGPRERWMQAKKLANYPGCDPHTLAALRIGMADAARTQPGEELIWSMLGRIEVWLGDGEAALVSLERAAELQRASALGETVAETELLFAMAHEQLGNSLRALDHLEQAAQRMEKFASADEHELMREARRRLGL